jgi:hypothetical protein
MAMLDTLKVSRSLREAGFSEPQAEALIAVVQEASGLDLSSLATKNDLSVTKSDLLQAITESKTETLKWVFTMIMGSVLINVATMIALVKLLGH